MKTNNMQATPYSDLKIFHHTDKIQDLMQNKRTAPLYIRIKPTNVCNQFCFYCSYSEKVENSTNPEADQRDFIPRDVMMRILDDISKMGVKSVTYSGGGEPLCYQYIDETLKTTLEKGLDLSMITNGMAMDKDKVQYLKHAKWVRISLDAAKPETYAAIRNIPINSLDKVINNIRYLRSQSDTTEIGINFVINHMNHGEVYDMIRIAKEIGCNHVKFCARIITDGLEEYHKDFREQVLDDIARGTKEFADDKFIVINKYESDFESDKENIRRYSKCWIKELTCVIAADCKVYYCHDKAYKDDGMVTSLKENSFKDIWYSEGTIKQYQDMDPREVCKYHCVYDSRNILLDNFFALDQKHINFI